MKELLKKLYELNSPCPEIDAELAVKLLGYTKVNRMDEWPEASPVWDYYEGEPYTSSTAIIPPFTRTIDGAVKLVTEALPGWGWLVSNNYALVCETDPDVDAWAGYGFNPAISLCIAVLEAMVDME